MYALMNKLRRHKSVIIDEKKPDYQNYSRLKMNKLHKKQIQTGIKDADEGKMMDSNKFWNRL